MRLERALCDELIAVDRALLAYVEAHRSAIPVGFREVVDRYTNARKGRGNSPMQGTAALATQAQLFVTEASYLMSDTEEIGSRIVERAFAHLQRSIMVDDALRERWIAAFKAGELQCEKLAAVHLLQHRVFAFKVQVKGAETDLVFQEPITDASEISRQAETFVLTEWKVVRRESEAEAKAHEARSQAVDYAGGVLRGMSLKRHRYIVLVSDKRLTQVPAKDIEHGDIIYRHVNVTVDPLTPAVAARRRRSE